MQTGTEWTMIIGIIFGALLFAAFIGLGVTLIMRYRRDRSKAQQSQNWPAAQGRVVESRVEESTSTDEDGQTSSSYRPYVRYDYEVGGLAFTGDRLYVGMLNFSSSKKKAQETAAQYAPGTVVSVFYNPENPAEAVLQQKTGGSAALVVGIILLIVGTFGICIGLIQVVP